jgi:hypothetical protein
MEERTKFAFDFAQKFVVQLITLASGIVALEIGLLKDHPGFHLIAILSWIAFGLSILAGIAAHQCLIGQLDPNRPRAAVADEKMSVYDFWIRLTAGAQVISFIVGVTLSIFLGSQIINGSPDYLYPENMILIP